MKIGSVEIIRESIYKGMMIAEITDGATTGWVCEPGDDLSDLQREGIRNIVGDEKDALAMADRLDRELNEQLAEVTE